MTTDQPPFDEATAGHLSMDEIADLDEGLLTDKQASAARAHLAGCIECSERAGILESSNTAVRNLGPIAIPDDVAARLDAALAAEAAAPAPKPDAAGNVTVMPDPDAIPRQRFRLPTAPAAAAAAVIVLAVVAIVVGHQHHHHHGISAEQLGGSNQLPPLVSNAPGGSGSVTPVSTGRVYDPNNLASYVPDLLSAAGEVPSPSTTASLGGTSNDSNQSQSSAASGTTGITGTAPTSRAGKHTTAKGALPSLSPPRAAAGLTFSAAVPAESARLYSDRTALLQCAAISTDTAGAVPLAVDFGRWSNPTDKPRTKPVPAIIFVFNSLQTTSEVDVFVVSPKCDATSVLEAKFGIPK